MRFFKKLGIIGLGLSMALGVGISLGVSNSNVVETKAADTKITDMTQVVSGSKYYIGATTPSTGGTDYYLSIAQETVGTGIAGTAKTSKDDAKQFTFIGSGTSWSIQLDSGNYLTLGDSKANGKVNIVANAATWTSSVVNSKLRLAANGSYSLQKNNSTTNFGSYGNTQTDLFLVAAAPAKTLSSIYVATAPSTTIYNEGESFDSTGMVIKNVYTDSSEEPTEEYTYSPNGALSSTDTSIIITSTINTSISCTQSITVNARTLQSVYVTAESDMTNKSYNVGDVWDYAGLVVMAHYSAGSDVDITNEETLEWNPNPAAPVLNVTSMSVAPSFGGKTAEIKTISGITVFNYTIYNFVTNYSTYASTWTSSYSSRTVLSSSLGSGLASAEIVMPYGCKQSSGMAIDDRPTIRGGTSNTTSGTVLTFKLTDATKIISAISVEFKSWNAADTFDIVLKDGDTTLATNSSASEDRIRTVAKDNVSLSEFSVTGQRIGLTSISIVLSDNPYQDALTWSQSFLSGLSCDSTGMTAPSTTQWSSLSGTFALLSDGAKNIINTAVAKENGTDIEKAVAKYDYIVVKYGSSTYTDFIDRSPVAPAIGNITNNTSVSPSVIVIIVVSLVSVSAVAGFFFLNKKRKETN